MSLHRVCPTSADEELAPHNDDGDVDLTLAAAPTDALSAGTSAGEKTEEKADGKTDENKVRRSSRKVARVTPADTPAAVAIAPVSHAVNAVEVTGVNAGDDAKYVVCCCPHPHSHVLLCHCHPGSVQECCAAFGAVFLCTAGPSPH